MNTTAQADRILIFARILGLYVRRHFAASTRSVYLTICDEAGLSDVDGDVVIRVSDHADAYATSDYSCDSVEGNVTGAKEFVAQHFGFPRPRICEARARAWTSADYAASVATIVGMMPHEEAVRHLRQLSEFARTAKQKRVYENLLKVIVCSNGTHQDNHSPSGESPRHTT